MYRAWKKVPKTKKKNVLKCKGLDKNFNKCRRNARPEMHSCEIHEYMEYYTDNMMKNLNKCSGCNKLYYLEPGQTCYICRSRGKENRLKNKEQTIPCKKSSDGCINQKSLENDYCGKHQTEYWRENVEKDGKKVCFQYIRGCRAELDLDYKYSSCQICLEIEKIKDYRRRAEKKGINIEFTDDQFKIFFRDDCFYCGRKSDGLDLNGIDRLNSQGDYDNDNCVSCCKMCNFMKRFLDPVVFIMRCDHILTFQGLIKGELNYDLIPDNISGSYNVYKGGAEKRDIEFNVTEKFFDRMTVRCCYLCGKESSQLHKNGIDRFDSKIGYVNHNCRSCCTECNFMKNKHSYDSFTQQLLKIYHYLKDDNKINMEVSDKLCNYYETVDFDNIIISMKPNYKPLENKNVELKELILGKIKIQHR